MTSQYNVVFCGVDKKVFKLLLHADNFKLLAVNYIDDFEREKPFNPIDFILKQFYICLLRKKNKWLPTLLNFILNYFYYCGSRVTKNYYPYLRDIFLNKLDIIDFANIEVTQSYIDSQKVDIIVVSNWVLLPDEIIFAPKHGTINIHPSKLPEYRGSVPTLWALKNKNKETAVTFMLLNSRVDGGEILSQHLIEIHDHEDSIALENKCDAIIQTFLLSDISKYLNGQIIPTKQNEQLASKTGKYHDYMKIDWATETCNEIVNKIKLYPHLWPLDCCYSLLENKPVRFYDAAICDDIPTFIAEIKSQPGMAKLHRNTLYVNTLNGLIQFRLFRDLPIKDSFQLLGFRKANAFQLGEYQADNCI